MTVEEEFGKKCVEVGNAKIKMWINDQLISGSSLTLSHKNDASQIHIAELTPNNSATGNLGADVTSIKAEVLMICGKFAGKGNVLVKKATKQPKSKD